MTLYADYTQIGNDKYYNRDLEARQALNNLGALAAKNQAALATDVSGVLSIANGGTGANNADTARTKLELLKTYGPDTLYVSTSGNDTTGDGTQNNPFRTIKKAVQMASYINVTYIYVAAGTYSESAIEIVSDKHINFEFTGTVTINALSTNVFRIASGANVNIEVPTTSDKLIINNQNESGDGLHIRTNGFVLFSGRGKLVINSKGMCINLLYCGRLASGNNTEMELNSTDSHMIACSYNSFASFGTIKGSTMHSVFYNSASVIRYSTVDATYQTLYGTSVGGRIYSGGQTSAPNY